MLKTDNQLALEIQRYGPISLGSDVWPHLDLALWHAAQRGGRQRLVVRGNTHILGNIIEPDQVARLIAWCRLRWAAKGVYP